MLMLQERKGYNSRTARVSKKKVGQGGEMANTKWCTRGSATASWENRVSGSGHMKSYAQSGPSGRGGAVNVRVPFHLLSLFGQRRQPTGGWLPCMPGLYRRTSPGSHSAACKWREETNSMSQVELASRFWLHCSSHCMWATEARLRGSSHQGFGTPPGLSIQQTAWRPVRQILGNIQNRSNILCVVIQASYLKIPLKTRFLSIEYLSAFE